MPSEFSLLRGLASLIDTLGRKGLPFLSTRNKKKDAVLFQHLLNVSFEDEQEVAKATLGKGYAKKYYEVLRSNLKSELLSTLFHLDLSREAFSEYAKAIYESNRSVFITQTLQMLGLEALCVQLAIKGLEKAEKYELTANAIQFIDLLRSNVSRSGLQKESEAYTVRLETQLRDYSNELRIRKLLDELAVYYSTHGAQSTSVTKRAQVMMNEIDVIFSETPRFEVGFEYYRIKIIALESASEYASAMEICNEALQFLDARPDFYSQSRYASFTLSLIECSFHARDLDSAENAIALCEPLFATTNSNWFILASYKFLTFMHRSRLNDASEVLNQVQHHVRYQALTTVTHQKWQLYGLYLQYASAIDNKKAKAPTLSELKSFRSGAKEFAKDKSGYNFAIKLLEILLLFEDHNLRGLDNQIGSLRQYKQRHLKNEKDSQILVGYILDCIESFSKPKPSVASQTRRATETKRRLVALKIISGIQVLPYAWVCDRVFKLNRDMRIEEE
jgi:hypothetical protein